jgi:hypothetical protein
MSMYAFGAGVLTGIRNDVSGVQTPRRFGTLQDVSLEFMGEIKELWGSLQLPEDVARGKVKVQGKAKLAKIQGRFFNDIFFGQTLVNGSALQFSTPPGESFTPGTGSVTYTVANSTKTPMTDQGVFYNSGQGIQLDAVASNPGSAQYAFNAATGVYTFASADIAAGMLVNYTFTATSGFSLALGNPFMGTTPRFATTLMQVFEGLQMVIVLNNCVANRLALPTRIDDYEILDMDFSAFASANGSLGSLNVAQ